MNHVIIIAEAGVNHNGSFEMARKLAQAARDAGADYVKYQTFKSENLVNCSAVQADYQRRNTDKEESQLQMLRKLELSFSDFSYLKDYCSGIGVKFLSTPFDLDSVSFLSTLSLDYMKIPSGEITNLPYLRSVARTRIPVIMSTGMCTLGQIDQALEVLYHEGMGTDMITLLHCNTEYPTPMVDVNLRAMESLRSAFGTKIGYSDHTEGIEVALAAVALGATVIEKHFTLDRSLPGPDHIASIQPEELKSMVCGIRNIELALGSSVKRVTRSERKNISVARKSIVAASDIREGDLFTENNLCVKRPGTGLSPMLWDSVIGRKASRFFRKDELIEL